VRIITYLGGIFMQQRVGRGGTTVELFSARWCGTLLHTTIDEQFTMQRSLLATVLGGAVLGTTVGLQQPAVLTTCHPPKLLARYPYTLQVLHRLHIVNGDEIWMIYDRVFRLLRNTIVGIQFQLKFETSLQKLGC
jgi:hypothetical protein